MLARTADNLYWLARYVERAEFLARILEVTRRLTTLTLEAIGLLLGHRDHSTVISMLRSAKRKHP